MLSPISWRIGLITASLSLALYQCVSAPGNARHHTDVGLNALLHPLGPMLLAMVPLLSLVLLVRSRLRDGNIAAVHAPTFIAASVAAEGAGLVLGLAHHGLAITLVLCALGIATSVLTLALGVSIAVLVGRRWAGSLSARPGEERRPVVCLAPPRGWDFTRAHARRGPPVATRA